jgi:hypothetical protein
MAVWMLNALVPPEGGGTMVVWPPMGLDQPKALSVAKAAAKEAAAAGRCLIGHPQTAALLGVAPSRGEAKPTAGDVAYVVRLRRRAAAPGDVDVTPGDLEMLVVHYKPLP